MTDEVKGARGAKRFAGRANDGADRTLTLQHSQQGAAGSGPQMRALRKDGWTAELRRQFLETLAATCNVSEAARAVGRNLSSAYHLKRRDPGFAREWNQALSIGYEELTALMLRQALFGTEEEEIVLDAEGAVKSRKIKRGFPQTVQARLFSAHWNAVMEARQRDAVERPDGEDAVERLRVALELVRQRSG